MSDCEHTAKSILNFLNREVLPVVNRNSQAADDFQKKVDRALPRGPDGYFAISFSHYGSAYEGLAVSKDADFDIGVLLGNNFQGENFTVKRDLSGFFTLEWKTHLPSKPMADCDDYLDAGKVRHDVFDCLMRGISNVSIPGAEIECTEGLHALQVVITFNQERKVFVDFVPQIVFRTWGQLPDLRPLGELPRTLRRYIDTLNRNKSPVMAVTMAVPGARRFSNSDQLFSASFAILEKKFLTSPENIDLRDMVRLGKLIAKSRNWKGRFGFHAFCIKRVAVKHCDELKVMEKWKGLKELLLYFSQEVARGFLDGFFIVGQRAFEWEPRKAEEFLREIESVRNMDPREIQRMV